MTMVCMDTGSLDDWGWIVYRASMSGGANHRYALARARQDMWLEAANHDPDVLGYEHRIACRIGANRTGNQEDIPG